jgi:hypothetical protein
MVRALRPLPENLAGVGVLLLGVMWSLGAMLANWEQLRATELPVAKAFLLIAAGGTLTVVGVWFGVGAVVWAMGRLLGGRARFFAVLLAVSAAAPPLWMAAPLVALALADDQSTHAQLLLASLAGLGVLGFLALLVGRLREVEAFSWHRALGCAALTIVFCASFLSLQHS